MHCTIMRVDGDPHNTCFAKWHSCIDLVRELREKRTMKKQRVSTGRGIGDGGGGREHDAGGERMVEDGARTTTY